MDRFVLNIFGDTHFHNSSPSSRKDDYKVSLLTKWVKAKTISPSNVDMILGDVFHSSSEPLKFVNFLARELIVNKSFKDSEIWCIGGNHDVLYSDMSFIEVGALGNFINTGLAYLLDRRVVHVGSKRVLFLGWNFNQSPPIWSKDEADYCILFGHAFYETSPTKGKDLILSKDEIIEGNYDHVFLGHDHAKYSVIELESGQRIHRPGSFSRGSSHFYNMWKEVQIIRLEFVDDNGVFSIQVTPITVPSLPPERVFYEEAISKDRSKIKKDLKDLILMMRNAHSESEEIKEVFNSIPMDVDVRDHFRNILVSYGFIL